MSESTHSEPGNEVSLRRRIVVGVVIYGCVVTAWMTIAGRLTWWSGWGFLLLFVAFTAMLSWRLWKLDPDLLRERNQPAANAEPWDRVVVPVYTALVLVLLVVAALDAGRFRWSTPAIPVQLLGWISLVAAGAMIWHVMMTNAYLSSYARLQEDRGQVVVDRGAYAYIRHPMYLAIIVAFFGLPLALGSLWSLLVSPLIAGIFVYRTWREDRMLMDGLAGYPEYANRVRYRLLPGIW